MWLSVPQPLHFHYILVELVTVELLDAGVVKGLTLVFKVLFGCGVVFPQGRTFK